MMRAVVVVCCALVALTAGAAATSAPVSALPQGLNLLAFPIDITGRNNPPITSPYVTWSFASGQTWINPFNTSVLWPVPDQLHMVNDYGSSVEAGVYYSGTDYAQSMATSFGLRFDAGMFALNGDVQSVRKLVNDQRLAVVESVETVSVYDVAVLADAAAAHLDPTFAENLNALPAAYDYDAYAEFFAAYGTHAISSAVLGGRARTMIAMDESFYALNSDLQIQANAELRWNELKLGFGGGYNRAGASVEFQEFATFNTNLEGGTPVDPFNASCYVQWVPTVPLNPALISMTLTSLGRFLPAGDTRIALFDKAVAQYVASNAPNENPLTPGRSLLSPDRCGDGQDKGCSGDGQAIHGFPHHCGSSGEHPIDSPVCCNTTSAFAAQFKLAPPNGASTPTPKEHAHRIHHRRPHHRPAHRPERDGIIPLPGADSIGVGYDVTRGLLRPSPVVQTPYTTKATVTDPWSGRTFLVPDNVNVTEWESNTFQYEGVFTSVSEYAEQLAGEEMAGLSVDGLLLLSESIRSSYDAYASKQAILGVKEVGITWACPGVRGMLQDYAVTPSFAAAINALPTTYDADVYREFVVLWGTHVVTTACLGGRARMEAAVSVSLDASASDSLVQVGLLFLDFSTGSNTTEESFQNATVAAFQVRGGSFEAFRPGANSYAEWMNTIPDAPTQMSRSLVPIHRLASLVSPSASLLLEQAVGEYLAEAVAEAVELGVNITALLGARLRSGDVTTLQNDNVTCPSAHPFALTLESGGLACAHTEGKLPLTCVNLLLEVPQPNDAPAALYPAVPCGPVTHAIDGYHMCPPGMTVIGWSGHIHCAAGECPNTPALCSALCF